MKITNAYYRSLRDKSPFFDVLTRTWHIADYLNTAQMLRRWLQHEPMIMPPPFQDIPASFKAKLVSIMPKGECDFVTDIIMPLTSQETDSQFEQDFIINVLSTSLYTLLNSPKLFAMTNTQPESVSKAIVEVLRYDPPLPEIRYKAHEQYITKQVSIQADHLINLNIAAANRDPIIFPDSGVFKFPRRSKYPVLVTHPHLIEHWQVQHILASMFAAMPKLRLATTPIRSNHHLRRFESLWIKWEPSISVS